MKESGASSDVRADELASGTSARPKEGCAPKPMMSNSNRRTARRIVLTRGLNRLKFLTRRLPCRQVVGGCCDRRAIVQLRFPDDDHILIPGQAFQNFHPDAIVDAGLDLRATRLALLDDEDGLAFLPVDDRRRRNCEGVLVFL